MAARMANGSSCVGHLGRRGMAIWVETSTRRSKEAGTPCCQSSSDDFGWGCPTNGEKMLPHEIVLPWFPVLNNQIAFMRNILAF